MNDHLRPIESSSIDEGLRTRLEGDIELLEDALPLLDSLTRAFRRDEPEPDDFATFRECVGQLPAIDEALDQASRHEQATALARTVGERKREAMEAGNARLGVLNEAAQPSLKAVTERVLARSLLLGRAPRPDEVRLATSSGWMLQPAVLLSMLVPIAGMVTHHEVAGIAAGLALFVALLAVLPSRAWILLPDRLYLPPTRKEPARQRSPQDVREVTLSKGNGVQVRFADGEALFLRTYEQELTGSLLLMLKSPTLGPLQSKPRASVVLEAYDDAAKAKGKALVSGEGVLFVPAWLEEKVEQTLAGGILPAVKAVRERVGIDQLLSLIAHVPAERMPGLGALLEAQAGVTWMPKGGVEVERAEGDTVHMVIAAGGKRLRVKRAALGNVAEGLSADAVLARLR